MALALVPRFAEAQSPAVHYRYSGDMPPGAIGSAQLQRGGPLPGYFQPVEIEAPAGAEISLAAQGDFRRAEAAPIEVGMLIGPVYRLRVTRIPYHEGQEVFPTIEVIDRLYPPAGQAPRFPIRIELTQEDLELALAGNFVTRVIYLEDPQQALPVAQGKEQISYDAGPGEDSLQMADVLGRPMAIVRLGGRVPILGSVDEREQAASFAPFVRLKPLRCEQKPPVADYFAEPLLQPVGVASGSER